MKQEMVKTGIANVNFYKGFLASLRKKLFCIIQDFIFNPLPDIIKGLPFSSRDIHWKAKESIRCLNIRYMKTSC